MPLQAPNTTQLNQIALRIASGLAAIFALLAVLLHQELLPWVPKRTDEVSLTAPPAKPGKLAELVSMDRRISFCAQHVTPERCFVIFQNGTCVIVNEPASDPIGKAKEILATTSGRKPGSSRAASKRDT